MSNFREAIPFILKHEGGFAETLTGEVVNRGINTETLKAIGYPGTKEQLTEIVKNLTVEETEFIYERFYWTLKKPSIPNALDQVQSQAVGAKIFDMAVLSGQQTAIKIVQRVLDIREDGYFGIKTLASVNKAADDFVERLAKTWSVCLAQIADQKISEDPTLIKYWQSVKGGWLARAAWLGV